MMKRYYIILLILTFIILVMTGCAKKCEDFNNDIIKWMPYKEADKIPVKKNNITDTLIVNYSEIHHTDKIASGSKCICENSYILNLSSNSLILDIRFDDSRAVDRSEVVINDEWMSFSEQLDSMEINGKVYSSIIVYKNTNQSPTKRFDRLIISKTIGIISITGQSEEWIITDDSIKEIEVSNIKLISNDC